MKQDRYTPSRRDILASTLASTVAAAALSPLGALAADAPQRRIKVGIVGTGGRGAWIANLFKQHGGFDFHAIADYFPQVAASVGTTLGIDPARRFSGLSGYQKVLASGIEAVILQTPPYFFPTHAPAAVEAGLHVYMAKPVASDVPGALAILAAGKRATGRKQVFMVDYQMPTDPINLEVAKRVREGGVGKISQILTYGICTGFADPPLTGSLESRLQHLTWVNDIAMGGDYIGNYDIHAIDAAMWVVGKRPVAASGASSICRNDPHGDAHDVCSVVYEYDDGLVHNHFGQGLSNNTDGNLSAQIHGNVANAQVNYWGKAFVRGGPKHYGGGDVTDLYQAGAQRNIADFYQRVTRGQTDNPTVARAVDGILTCILGREAAHRRTKLTMEQVIRENRKLKVDLSTLKP